jgi:hypothetical protein
LNFGFETKVYFEFKRDLKIHKILGHYKSFEAPSMGVVFPPPEASPLGGGGTTTFSPFNQYHLSK